MSSKEKKMTVLYKDKDILKVMYEELMKNQSEPKVHAILQVMSYLVYNRIESGMYLASLPNLLTTVLQILEKNSEVE